MNITLNLSGSNDSLDILKLCSLYCNNIKLEIPSFMDAKFSDNEKSLTISLHSLFNNDLLEQLSVLENEGILNFDYNVLNHKTEEIKEDSYIHNISEFAAKTVGMHMINLCDNIDISENSFSFFDNTVIKDSEAIEILKNLATPKNKLLVLKKMFNKKDIELQSISENISESTFLFFYLQHMLKNIYFNLYNNETTISNSEIINELLKGLYYSPDLKFDLLSSVRKNLGLNCMSILLPNISNSTFYDILEVRLKAQDELIELRYFIDSIVNKIDYENISNSFDNILITQINPALRKLERKFKDVKISVVQKFLTEIKNPLSYAPLLTTIFTQIPLHLSLAISLTGIASTTALEYVKQKENLKDCNLYFLLKIRNNL